jgi:hypothetical protein
MLRAIQANALKRVPSFMLPSSNCKIVIEAASKQ